MDKTWLNVKDAAAYTGYGEKTIRDAASTGALESSRPPTPKGQGHYRFRQEWLDQWLNAGRRQAPRPRSRRRVA